MKNNRTVHLSSAEFAKLIEDNLSAKSLSFAELDGGQAHPGNPTWFTSGVSRAGYNGVTWAQFDDVEIEQQVEKALEPFRQNRTPLTWWVGPLSKPGTLGRDLQARGFTHNRDMIGMAVELIHLPPFAPPKLEYTFKPINTPADLKTWMPLFMETFGVPASDGALVMNAFERISFTPGSKWRHYMISMGGQVIATSSLYLDAGSAGLYNIAARPEYRQNGLGTAITLLTYNESIKLGYHIGTLQTTYPNALRLYHRMGFEVYCKFGVYQRAW